MANKVFTLWMPSEIQSRLEEASWQTRQSKAEYIRRAIVKQLNRDEKKFGAPARDRDRTGTVSEEED